MTDMAELIRQLDEEAKELAQLAADGMNHPATTAPATGFALLAVERRLAWLGGVIADQLEGINEAMPIAGRGL